MKELQSVAKYALTVLVYCLSRRSVIYQTRARKTAARDASQSHSINQNTATSKFEMCFAIRLHHFWCRVPTQKVSNPAYRTLEQT